MYAKKCMGRVNLLTGKCANLLLEIVGFGTFLQLSLFTAVYSQLYSSKFMGQCFLS